MTATQLTRRFKPIVFLACLGPAVLLVWHAFTGGLSVNPIEDVTHRTGNWTLRFLLITLAITPARWATGWNAIIRFRRMLGLFTFLYATLHFSTYVVLDHFFALDVIIEDVIERKYVTAGFTGFVLLIPLAVTSSQAMMRRLGGKRWHALHQLIYVIAITGVVHFLWLVKLEIGEPLIYAAILTVLLGTRLATPSYPRRVWRFMRVRLYGWNLKGWRVPARLRSADENAVRSSAS